MIQQMYHICSEFYQLHIKIRYNFFRNPNDKPMVSYTCHTLQQLTRKTRVNLFYRAYSCKASSETDQTTTQVQYMNYRKADGSLLKGYRYTCDGDGTLAAAYASLASGGSPFSDSDCLNNIKENTTWIW